MSMRTLTRRKAGQVVGGSALALMLGGLTARPAGAQTRKQATKQANDESLECLQQGGDPDASVSSDGTIGTTCAYDDGSKEQCVWDASKNYLKECWVVRGVTRPPGVNAPIGGGGVIASGKARARPSSTRQQLRDQHRRQRHQPT